MERMTERDDEDYFKVLITGASGTGKTDLGVSPMQLGPTLVLLSERQGMRTIRDAAKRRGLPLPEVLYMRSLQDYRQVIRAIHGPRKEPKMRVFSAPSGGKKPELMLEMDWPVTVVLDSITDACELVRQEIFSESPPKPGEDGLNVITLRHFGEIKDRGVKLIRSFRDCPANVLLLALLQETVSETDNAGARREMQPLLGTRTMAAPTIASVNMSGLAERIIVRRKEGDEEGADREIDWRVRTIGPSWMPVKPYRPLKDQETPDFADWVRRIKGEGEGEAKPAAEKKGRRRSSRRNEKTAPEAEQ